jgi:hypothetical protein
MRPEQSDRIEPLDFDAAGAPGAFDADTGSTITMIRKEGRTQAEKRCRSDFQPLFGEPEHSSRQIGPAISHQPRSEGETETGSDHHLGKSMATHWPTLCRYPAGTMAGSRRKNQA